MNPFLQNIKQFLGRLTIGQQAALTTVVIGGIGLLIGIAYWAGRPDYALLFGKLDSTDAGKVVEALQGQGVDYEIRDAGTAIYVPRTQVYELRLQFAGEGLVSDGPAGYELFDGGTLGMTDFMQKLNLKRALEGELARTISSIRLVELCRVHLVMPERSPFRDSQAQPSASVVLQLAGGGGLSPQQIDGITQLVAGAVEGLSPTDVTVLDTRGTLLSNAQAQDPDAALGSTHLKMQRAVEAHLTEKGQTMLDRVLGSGNAIVRVTATLDYTKTVEEREVIDPESATVISEEELEEQGGVNGSATSSVRNYEISRTRERSEESVGDISYLTVSVILNYKQPPAPAEEDAAEDVATPEPVPYSSEEIANIESIVRNAVGFTADRGDRIAIHQTRFDTTVDDRISEEMLEQHQDERLRLYFRYGLMLLALGLAVWLIRSASRHITSGNLAPAALPRGTAQAGAGQSRTLASKPPAEAVTAGAEIPRLMQPDEEEEDISVDDVYMSKLSPEAKRRLKAKHLMYEEIKQQVLTSPEDTVELIRSWMAKDLKYEQSDKKPS